MRNYRIIKQNCDDGQVRYGLSEVYYDGETKRPWMQGSYIRQGYDSPQELLETFELMVSDMKKCLHNPLIAVADDPHHKIWIKDDDEIDWAALAEMEENID